MGARFKTEDGIEYIDTGEDDMLDKFFALIERDKAEQEKKNLQQSDTLRDKRMAGLPVKRKRNKK